MLARAQNDVRLAARRGSHQPNAPMPADAPNIISMLLEALTCPDKYEITERNGELFVTPIAARKNISIRLAE